jgi:antitoxin ParD1/3/4
MVITLTPEQEQLVQTQLAKGKYLDLNELITRALQLLVEREQALQQLEIMLVEGLDSGEPIAATDGWWDQKRANLLIQYDAQ